MKKLGNVFLIVIMIFTFTLFHATTDFNSNQLAGEVDPPGAQSLDKA